MTDIELTEFAAKAFGNAPYGFSPLTDDGDALRLAVKLKITVKPEWLWEGPWDNGGTLRDPYVATRRAIVRAAAEIGKGMK